MKFTRVLAFAAWVAFMVGWAKQVEAQEGIVLENVEAVYQFEEQVLFQAAITSQIPIQTVSILIFDHRENLIHTSLLPINTDGILQFVFDASQHILRPFTFVRWRYEFTLADDRTIQSETFSFRYDDNRFEWQKIESGSLRVFWFQGDASFAQNALDAARNGLDSINKMFPADLSQPVDIFIYPSPSDLQSFGVETWVAGYANSSSGVALVAIEAGANQSDQMDGRIPHELMHVMLFRHLGPGYDNVPVWLREGMATLVEMTPTTDYDRALASASSRNALIPLLDLCASFPAQPDSAFLAYAEARSFTTFLRESFGTPKLLDLTRTYADGAACERGVEIVYALTLAQLELDWRQTTFGQTATRAALQTMLPYLVLLCVVLVIPLAIGLNTMRKKPKK